jgi:hypothetical protein
MQPAVSNVHIQSIKAGKRFKERENRAARVCSDDETNRGATGIAKFNRACLVVFFDRMGFQSRK